jgi:2,3-bisphosphoglycerate-dependent phosphoglycerate mutase
LCLNIYFIRHAETLYRAEDLDFNRPLSPKGLEDAKGLINNFKDIQIDAIYSSPYLRAIDTIKPLAVDQDLDIVLINNLKERKVADHYIDDFFEFASKQWNDFEYSLPGGESLKEIQKRGIQALQKIVNNHQEGNIIIAGHGTWLGVMLNYFDDIYNYEFWKSIKMPDIFLFKYENNNLSELTRIRVEE